MIELHVATRRKERKTTFDLTLQIGTTASQEGSQSSVKAKFLAMMTYEVEHDAVRFGMALPESSPQLLQKKRGTVGRT